MARHSAGVRICGLADFTELHFVPTFFVPLEHTRMEKTKGAKLIEMTDLQWEFFFTCWKYNMECWRPASTKNLKFSLGVPIYYRMLGKKLFGKGIKYPLMRFAGMPDRLMRKRLYLDFTGYKRNRAGMEPFEGDLIPAFQTVQEKGLNMIDASQLSHIENSEVPHAAGD